MQENRRILAILWLPFGRPRVRVPRDRVRLAQLDFWETTDESQSFRLGTAGVPPIRLHPGNLLSLAGSTQRPNQGPRVGRVDGRRRALAESGGTIREPSWPLICRARRATSTFIHRWSRSNMPCPKGATGGWWGPLSLAIAGKRKSRHFFRRIMPWSAPGALRPPFPKPISVWIFSWRTFPILAAPGHRGGDPFRPTKSGRRRIPDSE